MPVISAAAVAGVTGLAAGGTAAAVVAGAANLLIGTALTTAINVGLEAAFGPDKPDRRPAMGIRESIDFGGDNPRTLPFGLHGTAGSLVWANSWTYDGYLDGEMYKKPNGFMTRVIALADMPVDSLSRVWVNGKWCSLVAPGSDADALGLGQEVEEFRREGDGKPHLWINFYDGTQTSADPLLLNHASNSRFTWDSARVGYGVAYAVVTAYYSPDLYRGFPRLRFELQGMPLYDPSKDTTVGGSGSHRRSDPSTWGGDGDDLPAVQLLAIMRGVEDGYGNHLYGFQSIADAQLPWDKWIAAINECRAMVDGKDGNETQYKSGGEVFVDREIGETIEALLTAMNGKLVDDGFEVFPVVGAPPASAVATFTDNDVLLTLDQTFTPFFGIDETVNGVTGLYTSPEEGWSSKAAPPIHNSDFEAEDGDRRLTENVRMPMVYRGEQAQRQLQSALREARRARRHTFALPPPFYPVQPGDRLDWNSDKNGYSGKGFRVDGVIALEDASIVVDLTEIDPTDYDYTSASDYRPVSVAASAIEHPGVLEVSGWTAVASTVTDDADDNRRPAILLGWDYFDGVEGVNWVVRNKATGKEAARGFTPTANGEEFARISGAAILPATTYEVRGRYRGDGSFPTGWSAWIEVTTFNIQIPRVDLDAEVRDALDDGEQALTDAAAAQSDALSALSLANDNDAAINVDEILTGVTGGLIAAAAELETRNDNVQSQVNSLEVGFSSGVNMVALGNPTASTTQSEVDDAWPGSVGANLLVDAGNPANPDGARLAVGDSYAEPLHTYNPNGNKFRARGRVSNSGGANPVKIALRAASGSLLEDHQIAPAGAGWSDFDITFTASSDVTAFRIGTDVNSSDPRFEISELLVEDVSTAEAVRAFYQQDTSVLVSEGVALAQDITTLQSDVGDAQADITSLQSTTATNESAIATNASDISTEISDRQAAISSEETARIDGDDALASDITSLASDVGDNTAAISNEATTRSNEDAALAQDITRVETRLGTGGMVGTGSFNDGELGDWIPSSNVSAVSVTYSTYSQAMRVTDPVSEGSYRRGNLNGRSFVIVGTARTNNGDTHLRAGFQVQAPDGSFFGLTKEVVPANSGWTTFNVTLTVNTDTVEFRPRLTFSTGSNMNVIVADIQIEPATAAEDVRASYQSDISSLVTADQALARVEQEIQATGWNNSATVQEIAQATSGLDGAGAVYGLTLSGGNNFASIRGLADGSTSGWKIVGDNIILDSNVTVFGGFEVNGDVNVVDGSIISNGMALRAATSQVFVNSTGFFQNSASDQWDDAISTNINMLGGTDLIVMLKIMCWGWVGNSSSDGNYTIRLEVDGSSEWQETYLEAGAATGGGTEWTYQYSDADVQQLLGSESLNTSIRIVYDKMFKVTGVPAGTRAIKVRFYANDFSGGQKNLCRVRDRQLWAVELRR